MNINKYEFHVQKIIFLEVLLSTDDIRMNSSKVQTIVDWKVSTCLKEIQIFIDFCNFYRRFIRNFFKIVRSMTQLTQKNCIFNWNEICQNVFSQLKQTITIASVLRHFDRTHKVVLETDFFDHVNVDVLSQYDDDDVLHSIVFYSKNILFAKCNYEIYNKKLLIIIRCLKHWRFELEATEISIEIFTDYKSLKHFMTTKKLIRRQVKWAEKLSEFNFKIMYQTDAKNVKIDTLTRKSDDKSQDDDDRLSYQHRILLTLNKLKIYALKFDLEVSIHDRILTVNKNDEKCTIIRQLVAKKKSTYKHIDIKDCFIKDGILYHRNRL